MKNFPKGKIVFLTDELHPEIRADDEIWAEDLRSHGYFVQGVPWEKFVEFESVDAVVFRSTWNYYKHYDRFQGFLDQLERSGVRAFNSTQMVRGNIDKRYLQSLEQSGVKIVPTQWVTSLQHTGIKGISGDQIVIKPTVSASSDLTFRISSAHTDRIEQALKDVLNTRSCAMIQPYLSEIEHEGEWSMIFCGERLIHTIRKFPKSGDFRVQAEHGGQAVAMDPPPHIQGIGKKSIAWVRTHSGELPLYARVDGVDTQAYGFLVMEVELTEPSLFFTLSPRSVRECTAALLNMIA